MNSAQAVALTALADIQSEGIAMLLGHNTPDESAELAAHILDLYRQLLTWLPSTDAIDS